jgi:hypothetical protein
MDAFALSDGTVLDYGLPDFSDRSLRSAPDREAIAAAVRRAIALFEPRLTDVKVAFTFASGNEQHAVLAIDGTLRVNQSVGRRSARREQCAWRTRLVPGRPRRAWAAHVGSVGGRMHRVSRPVRRDVCRPFAGRRRA